MAKYSFICDTCQDKIQVFCQLHDKAICQKCNTNMRLMMPILAGQEVRETINQYTGVQHKQDQKEMLAERKANYFWEVEVPRMVNSGTYSLETMLENGWVYLNEKDQLVTRTKPPQKE